MQFTVDADQPLLGWRCSFSSQLTASICWWHNLTNNGALKDVDKGCAKGIKHNRQENDTTMMVPLSLIQALLLATSAASILAFSRVPTTPAFGVPHTRTERRRQQRATALASASSSSPESHNDPRHHVEFTNLEPLPENDLRRERLARDSQLQSQFVNFGDELWNLRSQMDRLSARLAKSMQEGSAEKEEITRDKLRQAEQKDPELVYMLELADYHDAMAEGRVDDAALHQDRAQAARAVLPQFNLDGLWVSSACIHTYCFDCLCSRQTFPHVSPTCIAFFSFCLNSSQ